MTESTTTLVACGVVEAEWNVTRWSKYIYIYPGTDETSTGKLVEIATTHLADVKKRETLDLVITQGE